MIDVSTKVREAGVVGAGGAGFPTHLKVSAKAEIVLVNGAECEPLLKSDQQLAAKYPELIVKGLAHSMASTGASRGIIALKAKYKEAINALRPLLTENMEIAILPDIYPAGDEVMAIWLTTGRRVPPGGIPIAIGVVVNNIQTMINIAQAMEGIPVTTRTMTITGAVSRPITVTVPLGTRLRDVLELAGDRPREDLAYIVGGPVMGSVETDLNKPVTKTTGALIALPDDHPLVQNKQKSIEGVLRIAKTACEQCSFCTELCPRHLIGHALPPHLLIRAVNYNLVGNPELITSALICSECGVCEVYACPVGISPRRVNVALKRELRAKGIKYTGQLGKEDSMAEHRLVPSARLIQRLGLSSWYREAPLQTESFEPEEVVLNLQQHVGVPAAPIIKTGDTVTRGQVIGEIPEGALGARIHASISGTVTLITSQTITIRKSGAVL
ncbi:MAG: 4Fe-4S dicluster domain-containing protein [Bacillota bacterium]|nr:4Fe-4S dicluster domain-containing protein [Bacillota bacterium]